MFTIHPAILDTTSGSKLYLFKLYIKCAKELRYQNTQGKYSIHVYQLPSNAALNGSGNFTDISRPSMLNSDSFW